MTLFELRALTRYWRRTPPVHVSVAAYLGIGKGAKGDPADQPDKNEVIRELSGLPGVFSRGKFVPPIAIKPATH